MNHEKICCCRSITAGASGFTVQAIVLLLALSGSGLILDRYRQWKGANVIDLAPSTESGGSQAADSAGWADGWLELGLAWYVAFCTLWLFTVLLASLSFRYYRSVLIIPNVVVLCFGFLAHAFAFAVLVARLATPPLDLRVSSYEEIIICIVCGFILFMFLFNIVVLVFAVKFIAYLDYRRLEQMELTRPKTTHTSHYSDDLY
ncbi:hypothetical protein L596_006484 [Steinernema carpocapsae]|uniref:Uncharacterized protein n=1 Tax=Steinernema carpocapsae TaxID=34508 RepID=A0A4V6I905_STECR|nr:hypothetical protein L596_006484 [Steinernema carpocapsae]